MLHSGGACCSFDSLVEAQDLKVGDTIWVAGNDGKLTASAVSSLEASRLTGVFNPLTLSSTLIVNGISASNFANVPKFLSPAARQGGRKKQAMISFMWLFITPLFAMWTMLGTYWIYQVVAKTPRLMPGGMHSIILFVWQIMSYLWCALYGYTGLVAWRFERSLRSAESDLRTLEDDETIGRWGRFSSLESYRDLPAVMA